MTTPEIAIAIIGYITVGGIAGALLHMKEGDTRAVEDASEAFAIGVIWPIPLFILLAVELYKRTPTSLLWVVQGFTLLFRRAFPKKIKPPKAKVIKE